MAAPSQEPAVDPMMGADMGMGPDAMGGDPNAGMGPDAMNDGNMPAAGAEENYDADFDAGVEASEEEDPKKFNQQLTGKLSQSLQKYEDSLGGQSDDLPKYVGGMILAQLVKYMEPDEFDKMVKDAKDGMEPADMEGGTEDAATDDTQADMPQDDASEQPMADEPQQEPMNESVKNRINELFQNINVDKRDEKNNIGSDITTTKTGPVGYKRKAFTGK